MSRTPDNTPPAIPENDLPDEDADEGVTETPPPLNRADRRAQAKKKARPGHVGPQHDHSRSGNGLRPHTKRQV